MRLWPRRQGSSLDLLVVGLGNPGREYARNRHNAGWMVVDELARRHGGTWRSKFSGRLAEIRLDGHKLALLKPETYMNDAQHLGTPDFLRLRVGVGRPERGDPRPLADYVLSDFAPHDDAESLIARAADAVEQFDADGLERAQASVNRR